MRRRKAAADRQTDRQTQLSSGSGCELSEKMSAWGGWSSFNLQYKGIKRLLLTGQKGREGAEGAGQGENEACKGGRGKVKELNSKEHRGLKRVRNVKWPAQKRGSGQWLGFAFSH